MTFHLPTYRNSFHLGWLLLLLPPLAALYLAWPDDSTRDFKTVLLRVVLAAVAVGPLLWLRSAPVAGRSQRLLKELRTLLPGCLIALLVPGLLALGEGRESAREHAEWAVTAFGFGCLLMGASAFGSEFEQRTLAGLLGQPLPRGVVYLEKLGTLGLLLAFATVNLVLTLWLVPGLQFSSGDAATVLLVPVFAFCSGPLFSLLSRSTLAGMIFTLTVPFVVWLGTAFVVQKVLWFFPLGLSSEDGLPWLPWIGTPVYLLATATWGWRRFRSLEVRDGGAGGRSNTGLHPLSLPVDRLLASWLPAASGGARLIRKELRLHVVPWLVAGITVGLWILLLVLRLSVTQGDLATALNEFSTVAGIAGLLGTVILVSTGAACVAEERELGTLEWQLTQPAPLRRQWLTKVAVAAALALGLGVLLPATLVWASFDQLKLHQESGGMYVTATYAGFLLLAFTTSIYASSIARNTMMAVATAAGIGSGLVALIAMMVLAGGATLDGALSTASERWGPAEVPPPAWAPTKEQVQDFSTGFVAVTVILFVAALLWLGGRNYRRLVVPARDVSRQLAGVTMGLLILLGIFGTIMVQLVVLAQQASQAEGHRLQQAAEAEARRGQRAHALRGVRTMMASGLVTPAIYEYFGAPTNATPDALLDAVLAKEGPSAIYKVERLINSTATPNSRSDAILAPRYGLLPPGATNTSEPKPLTQMDRFRLDPILARRYGLIPKGAATGTDPRTNLPAASTNPPVFKMDPALMKRYGLQPRPSP